MTQILIRFIILVIIVSIPTFVIYKDYSISNSTGAVVISTATSTTTLPTPGVSQINSPDVVPTVKIPSVSVTPIENQGSKSVSTLPMPNLDKPWVLPADYSDEVRRVMNFKIDERTKDLKNNPNQFDKWLDLGYLRKTMGDYNETKVILEYAASGWPDSFLSYHNLGDLYANYLKDNAQAEKNMLRVVELDPHYVADYISLYELYKRMYGEASEKTGRILLQGIKSNPESLDLLMTAARHYVEVNDKENAKKYYNLAVVEAEKLKNDSLVKEIQFELGKL